MPIDDPVETPLFPTGISAADVEIFGALVYLWTTAEGSNVIHYVGEFELQLGERRLNADQAVIWMEPKQYQGRSYNQFEVYLWHNARVLEPSGTVTTGPVLFVTLNSFGKLFVEADDKTYASSQQTSVYQEGSQLREKVRTRMLRGSIERQPVQVLEPTLGRTPAQAPVRPKVNYRGKDLTVEQIGKEYVVTALGDVFVSQAGEELSDYVQFTADAAVLFIAQEEQAPPEPEERPEALRPSRGSPTGAPGGLSLEGAGGLLPAGQVTGAYLEGDVVISRGEQFVRADRIFYDFQNSRALILDAVMRTIEPTRNLPIYVRASQIRQLSDRQYTAQEAKVTTSEFYTPHYHIGAREVTLTDTAMRDAAGRTVGVMAGRYEMKDTTFNLDGLPLAYWPYARGEFEQGESVLRTAKVGYDDDFGATLETRWHLFNLLGLVTPQGFDSSLKLDYFTQRGPGVGIDTDYQRDDYFGLLRSYYIHDSGNDNLGRLRNSVEPDTDNRGRVLLRHRQYLPNEWQFSFELSYISDPTFLEEYFEREFDQGKEQETLLYLKKQHDDWAFTLLGQWRILDFLTQTERVPEGSFFLIGRPLAEVLTFYSENRLGVVRFAADNRRFFDYDRYDNRSKSRHVYRGDTRQEVEMPFMIGDMKLSPFVSGRASAWDDAPHDSGLQRLLGVIGVRGAMYFSRVFEDLQSDLLDVHGIRHIIKPDFVAWGAASNVDSTELYPFTEGIEDIDEISGATFGLRQRWQTRRGGPGNWRTVDWVTLDVEAGFMSNAQRGEYTNGYASYSRPEDSITANFVNVAASWRISDSTVLASEFNVDSDNGQLDVFDLSLAVERSPRLSYVVGYRYIGEIDSNLLGLGLNYQISKKYTLAVREQFDLDRGETLDFSVGFIRKFPRWYVGMTLEFDNPEDSIGLSLTAWPEGLPNFAIGPRRFTGLAESTGIRPGSY